MMNVFHVYHMSPCAELFYRRPSNYHLLLDFGGILARVFCYLHHHEKIFFSRFNISAIIIGTKI